MLTFKSKSKFWPFLICFIRPDFKKNQTLKLNSLDSLELLKLKLDMLDLIINVAYYVHG